VTTRVKPAEAEIFLLLKQQNEQAIDYLYDKYSPLIYGVILKEVEDAHLASEILKNTFINIVTECTTLHCMRQSFFTWILSIAKKTAISEFEINLVFNSILSSNNAAARSNLDLIVNERRMMPR
jgi:hypothetical protein